LAAAESSLDAHRHLPRYELEPPLVQLVRSAMDIVCVSAERPVSHKTLCSRNAHQRAFSLQKLSKTFAIGLKGHRG